MVYDHVASPPRFVAMRMEWMTGGRRFGPYTLYDSRDGVHWRARRDRHTGAMADRSTFFLNPLRSPPQWTLSLRENLCAVRVRVRVTLTLTLTLTLTRCSPRTRSTA